MKKVVETALQAREPDAPSQHSRFLKIDAVARLRLPAHAAIVAMREFILWQRRSSLGSVLKTSELSPPGAGFALPDLKESALPLVKVAPTIA